MRKQQYVNGILAMTMAALLGTVVAVHGGTFDPTQVSGLSMWLDASQITGLNDGDRVHQWQDNSGNNVDAGTFHSRYNNSPDRSPTFETNILSGQPVVRFDPNRGDSDSREWMSSGNIWASGTTTDLGASQDATQIMVWQRRTGTQDTFWSWESNEAGM